MPNKIIFKYIAHDNCQILHKEHKIVKASFREGCCYVWVEQKTSILTPISEDLPVETFQFRLFATGELITPEWTFIGTVFEGDHLVWHLHYRKFEEKNYV